MIDANDGDIYRSSFVRQLAEPAIQMEELFLKTNNVQAPNSKKEGSNPIGGTFATQGFDCTGYFISRHDFGIGDDRIHMLDVTMESLFGMSAPTPTRRAGRNLQCKQEQTMERYNALQEDMHKSHKLSLKMDWIETALDMHENGDKEVGRSIELITCLDKVRLRLFMS